MDDIFIIALPRRRTTVFLIVEGTDFWQPLYSANLRLQSNFGPSITLLHINSMSNRDVMIKSKSYWHVRISVQSRPHILRNFELLISTTSMGFLLFLLLLLFFDTEPWHQMQVVGNQLDGPDKWLPTFAKTYFAWNTLFSHFMCLRVGDFNVQIHTQKVPINLFLIFFFQKRSKGT